MIIIQEFYSVEDLKGILNLHEKTIQKYIREGKIEARKVGKSWRVTKEALKRFMYVERESDDITPSKGFNTIKVSSVVDIEVTSTDEGIKLANLITAAMNSKHHDYGHTSLNIQFIETENKIRLMLYGNVKFTEDVMSFLGDYAIKDQ